MDAASCRLFAANAARRFGQRFRLCGNTKRSQTGLEPTVIWRMSVLNNSKQEPIMPVAPVQRERLMLRLLPASVVLVFGVASSHALAFDAEAVERLKSKSLCAGCDLSGVSMK